MLFFENPNSVEIHPRFAWKQGLAVEWRYRRQGGRCSNIRVVRKMSRSVKCSSFLDSCRPSCRPNGQDDGRHDGRHENDKKAYASCFFSLAWVKLANLTIKKMFFPPFLKFLYTRTLLRRRCLKTILFLVLRQTRIGGITTIRIPGLLSERSSFLRSNETVHPPGALDSRDFKILSDSEFRDLPQRSQRAQRSEIRITDLLLGDLCGLCG